MTHTASEIARRLAQEAEAVCRYYLSRGGRNGRYWIVGDVKNTPGRSLFVRLEGPTSGPGAAGKWTDASTLEHGDLLDLIALNRDLDRLGDVLDEARKFLALPRPAWTPSPPARVPTGSPEAARRLFRAGRALKDTLAEAYLRGRRITVGLDDPALRFHPSVFYRAHQGAPRETWPALLAAVTDLDGRICGVHRTWLDPADAGKAPFADPRRALGQLLGNAVRFGMVTDVLAAGEGIESILSLKTALPLMPMAAGLSANHLAAITWPPTVQRLYVARDNDEAGRIAAERLHQRGHEAGVTVLDVIPIRSDFNADLQELGPNEVLRHVRPQLVPDDSLRFAP